MSRPAAGTTQKRLFSQRDYLAPLPIPTGEPPADVLNTIWRKNEVFLDIGSYSIGSGVMVIWPLAMMFLIMGYYSWDDDLWYIFAIGAGLIVGVPSFILIQSLFRPVPLPLRFNRQRREVCVPREDGEYWIVPWESVTAAAVQHSTVSQGGRMEMGLLFIGFDNPDPNAQEGNQHFSLGFNCGGGTTAMALWECMRSYMEVGPQAVPDSRVGEIPYEKTQIGSIVTSLRKGDVFDVLHGIFFITVFGTWLAEKAQNLKLSAPPDLPYPEISEWSKPLPPEQWAKRSPELEAAIAEREAELAAKLVPASYRENDE
ncbi:hypothetical protein CYD26_21680 [Pseudomonas sp. FFUP_PS_473]|uniref:DUF6708 domain-containing protein n=1 Tax=unclassified Pseudomonas TaxID=196821 RepID=UPI000C1872F6|nr:MULTISPECIES: DUF6708 domain-containing protein [unclassified Pseudomonas]ATR85598.1 hypothetical protein CS390_08170 [Pseudomonas sp. HLS-6]PLP87265.1 hypothetical protein CYD26_21680 [Pseudomonas sp. FFUP_PS_473]